MRVLAHLAAGTAGTTMLVLSTGAVCAACLDDIPTLRQRIAAQPTKNMASAQRELGTAEKLATIDEIGCQNAVTRAWRALRAADAAPPQKRP